MIAHRHPAILILLILLLAACTHAKKNSNQSNTPADSFNIENRKLQAQSYFKNHNYAASLTQWKILHTIDPKKREYENRIHVLNVLIERRVKNHVKNARQNIEKKNYSIAEISLLKALALEPKNKNVLAMLKSIEANRVESRQYTKTQRLKKRRFAKLNRIEQNYRKASSHSKEIINLDLGLTLFKKGDWSGSIREINKYLGDHKQDKIAQDTLANAHLNLSLIYESRGHLEPAIQHLEEGLKSKQRITRQQQKKVALLKKNISDNFYVNGVRSYRKDINQAIVYWKQAINYNPNHQKAISRLAKATQMQANLKKIKK